MVAGLGEFVCAKCAGPMEEKKCKLCSSSARKFKRLAFHDLRVSAIDNVVRGGISDKLAMSISGHGTRAVFDRPNITGTDDLHVAANRQKKIRRDDDRQKDN